MFKHRIYTVLYRDVEWSVSGEFAWTGEHDGGLYIYPAGSDIDMEDLLDPEVCEAIIERACEQATEDETLRTN